MAVSDQSGLKRRFSGLLGEIDWRVELPRHDLLLAEGLPLESYLDTGNRAAFANGGRAVQLHPSFAALAWANACAPMVIRGSEGERARTCIVPRFGVPQRARQTTFRTRNREGWHAGQGECGDIAAGDGSIAWAAAWFSNAATAGDREAMRRALRIARQRIHDTTTLLSNLLVELPFAAGARIAGSSPAP